MTEHASANCYREGINGIGALQERTFWHRLLLVCMAMAFAVGSPLPGAALNGEPVGAEGLHRAATCDTDFTISCDDRSQGGVVSCHMRGPEGDEGLAVNACIDGRVTTAAAQSLETEVTVRATDFGEYVCGKESDGSDFCVVCDTFTVAGGGASNCVKIVNNQQLAEPPTCGAFNVSKDTSGLCLVVTDDLQQSFSDPQLGFSIGINGSDAGAQAQKDLLVCGSRSWQCINNRSLPLTTQAQQVQQQQTHALIDTPCCVRLSSGSYYCSSKLTTCK